MASFATVLGQVMKCASLGASTNTILLKDLQQRSPKLEQVSNTFLQLAGKLRIVSFYELDKMDYMSSVVRLYKTWEIESAADRFTDS